MTKTYMFMNYPIITDAITDIWLRNGDPNQIPLEVSWDCLELVRAPAMDECSPMAIVAEGAGPQPGIWPEVTNPTPPERMTAHDGNGRTMRDTFLREGVAVETDEWKALVEGQAAE